jgi:elongation factor 1-alpha
MLIRTGWKKDFVANGVPIIPISSWMGDNLLAKSANMPWWNGVEVDVADKGKMTVVTLMDCLNDFASPPVRLIDAPMRCPISGIYKIRGVGDVLAGRVEQGVVHPGEDAIFLPTHTTGTPCGGKILSVEMHHTPLDSGKPGDHVGLNIKGLDKNNMPRSGDVMVYKKDGTLKATKTFTCQIMTLDHIPGELTCGYSPIGFVRSGRAACRMTEIIFKVGKETGGAKLESPANLKANEVALATFEPMTPFVCDSFKNCEGLSRIVFLDGNTVVILGKVISVTS